MQSDYEKALQILTSQGRFYINLGLERVQKILNLMGNPQDKLKFIHVAGTNGKGSVCAMLSAILGQKKRVGLFTSPHIFDYTERIKINDVQIDKKTFAQKLIEIVDLAQKNEVHLTEFEILTVLAFDYFAQNKVDVVVLETGLGGRFDATNVIKENICSVICHIDYDHTERLGDTIEKIAFEKAGIIKENCPVVVLKENLGFDVIRKNAKEKNSDVIVAPIEQQGRILPLAAKSALKGTYQIENLALVLEVCKLLNICDKEIEKGLGLVKHPCRFEYLKEYNIIIDGAHNPNGIKALRESLENNYPQENYRFIFGCLKNKEYEKMLKLLLRNGDEVYFNEFSNPNCCKVGDLKAVCPYFSKTIDEFKPDKSRLTVVCGSFYMIKELLEKMGIK